MRRAAALLSGLALLSAFPSGAGAQSATMRQRVYERLAKAEAEAVAGKHDAAVGILEDLAKLGDLTPYERAQLHTAFGFVLYSKGDVAGAAREYGKVLEQPELPPALASGTLYTLAQLSFQLEDYAGAVARLDTWLAAAQNPGPEPYVLLAQAYYFQKQYGQGVAPAKKAIAIAESMGRRVEENWYLLLRVFYYELGNTREVVRVLEELVRQYPKKEYWLQLAVMYGEAGADRSQLGAFEVAEEQGFLETEPEIVGFAQVLLQAGAPYRAGKVLAEAMEQGRVAPAVGNWRLLSQAWALAREDARAIQALTAAAGLSDDGELDARLAIAKYNVKDWAGAVEAARIAIRKGVDRSGEVGITLGMALLELDRRDEARAAFRKAQESPESRATASQWLAYLDREEARLADLAR